MQYIVPSSAVFPTHCTLSISRCDLSREWTFMAHWLSPISPVKTLSSAPKTDALALQSKFKAIRQNNDFLQKCIFPPHLLTSEFDDVFISGSTTNFRVICSWPSLQMTVQTTWYSPGSTGAVSANSWMPGLSSNSHPGTGLWSLGRSRENPCIEPSLLRSLARIAVIR